MRESAFVMLCVLHAASSSSCDCTGVSVSLHWHWTGGRGNISFLIR